MDIFKSFFSYGVCPSSYDDIVTRKEKRGGTGSGDTLETSLSQARKVKGDLTSPQFFLYVPYSFQSLNPTSIQRGPPDGRVTRVDIAYVRRISQDMPRPFPLAEKKKGDREEKQSYGQLKVEGEERKNLGRSREENPPLFFLPLVHALMTVVKRREERRGRGSRAAAQGMEFAKVRDG